MILVTGATGAQGGATVRALLAREQSVRALVRDPDAPAAKNLADLGVELVAGDMADRGSLDAALSGVDGVFSVQPAGGDEVLMGHNVADATAAAGIEHLVYTSVGGVEKTEGIGSWDGKLRIERHIRELGVPTTFLRPVKFMENLIGGADVHTGQIRDLFPPDRPTQVIAVDDIGWFAAAAFADPATYQGHAWEIAGDELTHQQMAAAISTAIGRPITYVNEPAEDFAARRGLPAEVIRHGMKFVNEGGWHADIPALRVLHPGLMDFTTWLARGAAAKF
jgi:uncharacterized protein YbjT (DUF2867 family)